MGKILQIRVIATTYRVEDVEQAWPRLSALAWPNPPRVAGPPAEARGVLELVATAHDRARFVHKQGELDAALLDGLAGAAGIKARLEAAPGDWDAEKANALSRDLEAALSELEELAPERPFVVTNPDAHDARNGGDQPGEAPGAAGAATVKSSRIGNFFKALAGRS